MSTTSADVIASRILTVRGRRVMLDSDLAELYGVATKRLKEQVRRNRHRFPADFVFEPTTQELAILRSHFATSSWGGLRYRPLVFTEHGAIQAATVLRWRAAINASERAERVTRVSPCRRNDYRDLGRSRREPARG